MKTLLIGALTLISSFNLQAAEYVRKKGSCIITVTESDLFNEESMLPFKLKADFVLAFDKQSKKLLAHKLTLREELTATTPVDVIELEPLKKSFKFKTKGLNKPLYYQFSVGDSEVLSKLFLYAGSYRAAGLDFPSVSSSKIQIGESVKLQSHLPPTEQDGLSYHLYIQCSEKGQEGEAPPVIVHEPPQTPAISDCEVWMYKAGKRSCALRKNEKSCPRVTVFRGGVKSCE
jgi:hypothetical protein